MDDTTMQLTANLVSSQTRKVRKNDASIWGAVLNISTGIIGVGIMSIPATIKLSGIIPGFITLLIVAFLVETTAQFMLSYTESGHANTYAALMGESFGRPGSLAVQISVSLSNFGCLIIYFIIIGDVLCGSESGETLKLGILQEWFGIHWWNSRTYALLFLVLFIILPMVSLSHSVDSLKYNSGISILLSLVFIGITSSMAISAMWQGKTQKLRLFPDSSSQSSMFDLFSTIPVFASCLAFHAIVHPVRAELGEPNRMRSAIRISLTFSVAIYVAVGISGYLLFGDSVMPDILVNFDQNSDTRIGQLLNDIVRLSYALHLILVFPMLNFILRATVDELVFPNKPMLALDTRRFLCLTCGLLSLSYLAAVAVPNIWYFFQLIGSTSVACNAFIFPGSIILRNIHGISTRKDKFMAVLVITFALGTSSFALYNNLFR
ncbi:Transmembrane amino acid transporter family protein [Euphorbia peplus]|nr:Transmembrane amino acid transporter family protein [Euphorbia peplus]